MTPPPRPRWNFALPGYCAFALLTLAMLDAPALKLTVSYPALNTGTLLVLGAACGLVAHYTAQTIPLGLQLAGATAIAIGLAHGRPVATLAGAVLLATGMLGLAAIARPRGRHVTPGVEPATTDDLERPVHGARP